MTDSAMQLDSKSFEPSRTSLRLGVYEISGGVRTAIARLQLSVKLDGSCDISISSESDAAVSQIKTLIQQARAGNLEPPQHNFTAEESLERTYTELKEVLAKHCYEAEELPAADHSLSFTIDLQTGTILGTQTRLHDAVASDHE